MLLYRRFVSMAAFILSLQSHNSQPAQITIKAEVKKVFDISACHIDTFSTSEFNMADCLERCLKNCRCQSFQICKKTKFECQLCSSHKDNNLTLHDDKDCVYATYEMRNPTGNVEETEGQCSDMSCAMKYNCCQQSGLCPAHKICKPINSLQQPWKRFTCECQDGYHGDDCNQPITSCDGYANSSWTSGWYKVVNKNDSSVGNVYCHFDSDGAWTLRPHNQSASQCFKAST